MFTSDEGTTCWSAFCINPEPLNFIGQFWAGSTDWNPIVGTVSSWSSLEFGSNFDNSRSWQSISSLCFPHAAFRF